MKIFILTYLYFVSVVWGEPVPEDSLVVNILQGSVKGYKESGNEYFSFYGIPYATAPKGSDKFKAPLPAPTWSNVLEATNKDVVCPQSKFLTKFFAHLEKQRNIVMHEDCLNVNVFTPGTDRSLPVFVYIHGGAFQIGFGDMNSHQPLLKSKKYVEVNVNYRLGIPGFLCLGTEDAPGNAGMKDQLAALRWVKENIAKFGGNPEDVTLAGYSAGSASVDLHLVSEASRGLFHRIIPESGSAISSWAVQIDPLATAIDFARSHNFTKVHDVYELEKFYKSASDDVLFSDHFFYRKDSEFAFVPCVEREKKNSFLYEAPLTILKRGNFVKMPALYGTANMEGLFRIPVFEDWKSEMNANFANFLPVDLGFKDEKQRQKVAGVIKNFYFGDQPIGRETLQAYVNYFSDIMFVYPLLKTINLFGDTGSVYAYEFSFVDSSRSHPFDPFRLGGAHHCAQSEALSYNLFIDDTGEPTDNYRQMRELMKQLWLNFITTSKPVLQNSSTYSQGWPAYSQDKQVYMELKLNPELKMDLVKKRYELWDCVYGKYWKAPKAPPAPTR